MLVSRYGSLNLNQKMNNSALKLLAGAAFITASLATPAHAIIIMVGDNDGYGQGIADGGNLLSLAFPSDNRSAGEAAATNGAQQTDFYTSLFSPLSTTTSILFPFVGTLTSATLTVDMGGFQATTFGALGVNFNGISQNWGFEDGAFTTTVRTFVLSAAELAAANSAGQFVINLSRGNSADAIAFDYFKLDANVQTTSTPDSGNSLGLLGLAIAGLAGLARRRK